MSEFSQTTTSSFPDQNILYNSASGITAQGLRTNELLNQGRQLDLSNANMEQVSRVAAALLNEPDPAKRAELYPRYVGSLQSQGYAMHAPATLPDEQTLQMLARQGTPSQTQAEWLANIQANKQYSSATGTQPPAQGSTGTGAGTTAQPAAAPSGAGTATIGQRQNNPGNLTFAGQPGASPGQGNRFAAFPDMPTGVAATANQLALYQEQHGINTVRGAVTRWVSDPKADLTSYTADVAKALGVGPDDPIDLTNPDVQAKFIQAQFPHESAGGGYVLNPADVAKGVQMAAANRGRTVQAPGTAIATAQPATAPAGGGGTPGLVQVASAAPTVPVTATDGTTAPPASAPAQPQAAPAGGPQPPQLTPTNANGLTAQQQAQIDAVASTGRMTVQQRMAAEQGFRNQNIQLQQKAFSDWIQVQTLNTAQGQLSVSQQNSALEYWKAAHPDAKVTMTGGEIVTQDPRTGQEIAPRIQVTPQRADTAAMAIVSRLGPKVANGTATPEEQAQYAVAVDSYRQPVLRENPVSKETVRVNTRELPAGFPEPPSLGGGGAPGGAGTGGGGSNVVMPGLSPQQQEIERDPAAYEVAKSQYDRNAKEIDAIGDAGRQAQADQIRIKEMQDVLQKFNSGRGTEAATAAAAWFNSWAPAGLTGWKKESENLSGSQAAEAFSKLALVGAGTQERSVLGARGGYQAIKLFKEANPNINLQDATNKSILDMQLISNQANADYSQAALSHFADNETKFAQTHKYESLQQFDRNWNAQRNPQVYSAAMGAISGQPASQWAKGLSDDEYTRALQMVQRAKPSAVVNTKSGRYSMEPNAVTNGGAANSKDTVIRYDHSGNRIQ